MSFTETLPGALGTLQVAPGTAPGPGGSGGAASPSPGAGWEVRVLSYKDYSTVLALLPPKMIQSFQFVKQLNDTGSATITLNMDDPWWHAATLTDGAAAFEILDYECLWQFTQDGVPRFEFLGETVTEQLVDSSEQRLVTVTGPGAVATLKWAMAAPNGFPSIVNKLDSIADSFDEVNVSGQPVLDTNIWNVASPAADVLITPVSPLYQYPGGAGYALSSLYPSGTLTITGTAGTTVVGATPYDAADTLISAQVTPVGAANIPTDSNGNPGAYGSNLNGSELTEFYIQSLANSNNYALIGLSANSFYCQLGTAGQSAQTHIISGAASFDASNDAYWMITEQAGSGGGPGTFYFWTSPDGSNWTLQWQVVHSWDATYCGFYVSATYNGTGQSAILANLNSNVTTPSYQGNIYLSTPAMGIWHDLLQTAQARGTVPFVTSSLSGFADSYGRQWTDSQNVQVTNGTDLYSLLQSFCAVVNADFMMQPGFQLLVGLTQQGSLSLGADRSGSIVFREGRDLTSKQRSRARNQVSNLYGAENSDGHEISATNSGSITKWGQREAWYQTAAQVDPASMEIAAAAAASDAADEVLSYTLTIPPGLPGRTVFASFDCGDWVGLERPDFSAIDAVRVVGIAVQVDSSGNETNELTIESYTAWLEEQLTYLANKLGGQFVNAQGTTPVAPSKYGTGQVPTYFTPAQSLGSLANVVGTAGHNASPLVYNAATGQWQPAGTASPGTGQQVGLSVPSGSGTVTVNNGQVTASAAPTPIAAPDGGGSPPVTAKSVISPTVTQLVDATGTVRTIVGQQADGTYTHADVNGPAPGVPDAPSVTGTFNGLFITWDGKIGGANPLADFLWVEVHLSTSSGFTPSVSTLTGTLVSAGTFPVTGLQVGTTYYVKLLARNTSTVAGSASSQVSGVPTSLTATLAGPAMGVLNANPYFLGGDGTGWAGVSGSFSVSSSPPAGSPLAYAGFFSITTAGVGAAAKESGAPFAVAAGQQYLVTAWVYTAQTSVTLGFDWQNSSHSLLSSATQSLTVPANTWTLVTTVQTAPGSAVWGVPRIAPADGSGHTLYFEAILVMPQVPGALIQAGTITAFQIASATITAAQIASGTITAGQIAANTITGANIAGGTITASNISAGTISAGLLAAGIVVAGIVDGTTVTGATIVADGTSGEVLVYSGLPASGNLIGAWSGAAGSDASSNAYPLGLYAQALTLPNQASAPPAFTGASVFYSSVAGRPRYVNSIGNDSVLERSTVNVSSFTVGNNTSFAAIGAALNYLANEGAQSSEFEIEIDGVATTANTGQSTQTLSFGLAVDGTVLGGQFTVGAVFLPVGNKTFSYTIRFRLSVQTTGGTGTGQCNVTADGGLATQGVNAGSTTTPVPTIYVGAQSGPNKGFDTTSAHTLDARAAWGGNSTGQTLTTYRTKLARRM